MTDSAHSPEIKDILVAHHSHMDVGYTHSQPVFWRLQSEFLDQVLDWLDATADLPVGARPKWTCEASEPVRKWLATASPVNIERFVRLHKQGRLGVAAMRWHTTPLADRAGLQRLLEGKRELEELLGAKIPVACQHDVTGVPWPLADVLLDAGVDFLIMAINIHLGRAVQPRPGMFLWEAPSGRSLRVFNGNHYTMFDQLLYAWDDSVDRMREGWTAHAERLRELNYPFDFVYLTSTCSPVMWDNAPPNPFLPDLIQRWNESGSAPAIGYATFDDLRERAMRVSEDRLLRMRGDWTDFWNFGAAASPVATSRNQRAKPLMAAAERLGGHAEALAMAKERVDLYDEHTCGYYDSDHANPQAQTTEILKQALAHEGHEHAAFALMDALDRLAGNPLADRGIQRVLLVNPDTETRMIYPELPGHWFSPEAANERSYRASRIFHDGRPWEARFAGSDPRCFGPITLPGESWAVLPLNELPPLVSAAEPLIKHKLEEDAAERRELNFAPAARHRRRTGCITTPYHCFRYDPDSGRILSLVDHATGRDVLAPRQGIDLFSFVRERTDALVEDRRYAFYQRDLDREKFDGNCWQDWSPIHESASRVIHCEVLVTPTHLTFLRRLEAPGILHCEQRYVFSPHDPVIRIEVEMELIPESSPQSIYFATALAMEPGWQAGFDTAGQWVRMDDDQLPGSCRNWVTANSVAALWNAGSGVALFTADAPMLQFGDYHFGRPLDQLPRPENPLLLAWPVNNYWDTNFPRIQAGRIALRYGMLTGSGPLDGSSLMAAADRFRQPQLLWPVTTGGRAAGSGKLSELL